MVISQQGRGPGKAHRWAGVGVGGLSRSFWSPYPPRRQRTGELHLKGPSVTR